MGGMVINTAVHLDVEEESKMIKKIFIACMITLAFIISSNASTLVLQPNTLYQYKNIITLQDDFLSGTTTSGQIGFAGWATATGAYAFQSSEANYPGILRVSTTAVINTTARLFPNTTTSFVLFPSSLDVLWIARLNTNDANTTLRMGAFSTSTSPIDGQYFEKLDADINWFCVNASAGQTRADSGVAVDTNFHRFRSIRNQSNIIKYYIDGVEVCSITANITPDPMTPIVHIVNSDASEKTVDIDYFQMRYMVTR